MKYITLIFISTLILACSKDQVNINTSAIKSLSKSQLIDGRLDALLQLAQEDVDGMIRFEDYSTIYGKSIDRTKYAIIGTFDSNTHITATTIGGHEIPFFSSGKGFQYDNTLPAELVTSGMPTLPNYFGSTQNIEFGIEDNKESVSFRLIESLTLNETENTPDIYIGRTVTWNEDPSNEHGVFFIFQYTPNSANSINNKIVWYAHANDTGTYTFTASDFPHQVANDAIISCNIIRGTVDDVLINNQKIRLLSHSSQASFFKYKHQ